MNFIQAGAPPPSSSITNSAWQALCSLRWLWTELSETGQGVTPWPRHGEAPSFHLQLHEGVRVPVGIHGSQVHAAHDAHDQPPLLRAVHQGHQDLAALLNVPAAIHLRGEGNGDGDAGLGGVQAEQRHEGHEEDVVQDPVRVQGGVGTWWAAP